MQRAGFRPRLAIRPSSAFLPGLALVSFILWGCVRSSSRVVEHGGPRGHPLDSIDVSGREMAQVQAARERLRAHDTRGALDALEAHRGLDPREPARSWMLVAIWAGTNQRHVAETRARALTPGPIRDTLIAVASEDPAATLDELSVRASEPHPWRDLAIALLYASRAEHDHARRFADRTLSPSAPAFVVHAAHRVLARGHALDGNPKEALRLAHLVYSQDPGDTRNCRLLAELYRRGGDLEAAVRYQALAVSSAPHHERYARKLAELLRRYHEVHDGTKPLPMALDVNQLLHVAPQNPELHTVAGYIARAQRRFIVAEQHFEQALARGAVPILADRDLRELHFRHGRFADGLRLLQQALPPGTTTDVHNIVRPAWDALNQSVHTSSGSHNGSERHIASCLLAVGALRDARAVASRDPSNVDLVTKISAHLAFERSLRALTESDYRNAIDEAPVRALDEILAKIPALMCRHLPPDDRLSHAQVRAGLNDVLLIGSWLDHRPKSSSPLVRYFRRWNRYLILGQRQGSPVEAISFSIGSMVCNQKICSNRQRQVHHVVVGYDRDMRSLVAADGGNLGGACLPDGVWLDADATRETEGEMRRAMVRDPYDAFALSSTQPTPVTKARQLTYLGDGGSAADKLVARYVARNPSKPWGSFYTLRAHEFGHIADLRAHYPLLEKLPANLALFFRHGASPVAIERALERRAQLGAVIDAPDPDLAVAEMLQGLPLTEDEPEVHAGGYADGLADMVRYIAAHPREFPQIDRRARIVDQLPKLSNAELQRVARCVIGRR